MCGRLWQAIALHQLVRMSNVRFVRNADRYNGTYNMGPTHYIPAIRSVNRYAQGVQDADQLLQQPQQQQQQQQQQVSQQQQIQQQDAPQQNQLQQLQLPQNLNIDSSFNNEQISELSGGHSRGDEEEKLINTNSEQKVEKVQALDFLKWGFQTKFSLIINIRIEEAHDKQTFKPLINKNRCVVLCQGYYEWTPAPDKNPYCFKSKKQELMLVAGLYSNNDELMVLTREAFGGVGKVHHRMPVLLQDFSEVEQWLDTENYPFHKIVDSILLDQKKSVWNEIDFYRIGPAVSNIREKSAKCIQSFEEYMKQLDKIGIKKFFKPINQQQKDESTKKQATEDNIALNKQEINTCEDQNENKAFKQKIAPSSSEILQLQKEKKILPQINSLNLDQQ